MSDHSLDVANHDDHHHCCTVALYCTQTERERERESAINRAVIAISKAINKQQDRERKKKREIKTKLVYTSV